eukprot:TRINITY_DN75200_c0_g1_i1.p1 TRINITY_DN75200_c0_g1~~TRINITY_DN75200_c0_g1_i1.p1  ORF type:complete len:634 (-),score=112.78 TRINITY_DN75200_c0_g1_i1:201-1997(-)
MATVPFTCLLSARRLLGSTTRVGLACFHSSGRMSLSAQSSLSWPRQVSSPFVGSESQQPCKLQRRLHGSIEPAKLQEDILLCPDVANCQIKDDDVYVVRASKALLDFERPLAFLQSGFDEAALRTWLKEQLGYSDESIPHFKFVDKLPGDDVERGPFMLQHILHALFDELDRDGDGNISLQEFIDFCTSHGLCESEADMRRVFKSADKQVLEAFGAKQLDLGEFKSLVLETGIVEVRGADVRGVGGAYFVEEKILDVVLQRWFSKYDANNDGGIDLREYCRLVADYQLPFAVSADEFRKADKDGNGVIDLQEFQALLQDAKVLATGAAIARQDDAEGMRKTWRALETSQVFLPPNLVYSAAEDLPVQDSNAVRFVCISDTHGAHDELTSRLPSGDVLLHAGDFSMCGDLRELESFGRWLASLPYSKKIVIAGNHDLGLDEDYEGHKLPQMAEQAQACLRKAAGDSLIYLQDEAATVFGVRIYGSPWSPAFGSWAFGAARGGGMLAKWHAIPDGVDVLLVHGPPLGRGDRCYPSETRVGCADLLTEIQSRIRPSFCVSGHVHESYGVSFDGTTHYVNATSSNGNYECEHAPLVFDMPRR